jgi:cytochrome c oxidase cbb3-type subunit 4
MDINVLRSLITVASLAAFLAIVWWAYAPSRRERFERDALLPFEDDGVADASAFRDAPHPWPLSRRERGNERRVSSFRPIHVDREGGQ